MMIINMDNLLKILILCSSITLISGCASAPNQDQPQNGFGQNTNSAVASANLDLAKCEKMPESDGAQLSSKYECISRIANLMKDWKLCQKLANENYKNLCIKENAWSQLDGSICYNVATPSLECESGKDDAKNCTAAELVFKQCRKAIEDYRQICKSCYSSTGAICPADCRKIA